MKGFLRGNEAETKMSDSERPMNDASTTARTMLTFMGQETGETPSTLWVPHPCGFTRSLIRMTFFAPTTPTETAKQRSPAHVAATFQQRPRINTTDLILEMARKEQTGRKKGRMGFV